MLKIDKTMANAEEERTYENEEQEYDNAEDVEEEPQDESEETHDDEQSEKQKRRQSQIDRQKQRIKELSEENERLKSDDSEESKITKKPTDTLSREEAIMFAQGHSEDEVEYASKVAKIEGVSLLKASETSLFKNWKAQQDREQKMRDSSIENTGRGKRQKREPKVSDSNLKRDEHKKLWEKAQGR